MANKPLQSIKFPGLDDTYTVPVVDSTLTQSGGAADAKKVGDEITQLKSDFDEVITYNESENILDPDTSIIIGYYVPNGGGFSDNNSFRTIDYVPVIGGKYLISSNQNGYLQARFIVEYDANKNVINAASESTEGTGDGKHYTSAYLLLNSNTRYVRITYRTTSLLLDTIMLSLSDDYALPEFQPYFDPYYAIKPNVIREYVRLPMHIYAEDGIGSFYAKMTEAYTSRNRDVYIHKGDYVYTNAIIEQIRSDGRRGVPIGNGCRYFFETGANIYCEYTGSNAEDIYTLFSPLDSQNVASDYELHNLKIVAKNVLYAVHDEANGQDAFCKHVYKDCYIELDNTDIGESSTYLSKAIGGGLGKHEEIIIENCVFKAINPGKTTNAQQDVSYHGANNSTFSDVHIVLSGCYFITGVFRCGNIAANTEAPYPRVVYTNNSANGGESIDALWDKYVWNNINRLTS